MLNKLDRGWNLIVRRTEYFEDLVNGVNSFWLRIKFETINWRSKAWTGVIKNRVLFQRETSG